MLPSKWRLFIELMLFYIGLPLLLYFALECFLHLFPGRGMLYFLFMPLSAVILFYLYNDPSFEFKDLLHLPKNWKHEVRQIAIIFLLFVLFSVWGTYFFLNESYFYLPKKMPFLWLAILCIYPLISVIPQGLAFRVLLFHRYRSLLGKGLLSVFTAALVFGFGHIFFSNVPALTLTFLGGLSFAYRYHKTSSFLLSSLEHLLYGSWLLTVGLANFFINDLV